MHLTIQLHIERNNRLSQVPEDALAEPSKFRVDPKTVFPASILVQPFATSWASTGSGDTIHPRRIAHFDANPGVCFVNGEINGMIIVGNNFPGERDQRAPTG